MSLSGEIVIECDVKDCHAEQRFEGAALLDFDFKEIVTDIGWRVSERGWICPQCSEEGKTWP